VPDVRFTSQFRAFSAENRALRINGLDFLAMHHAMIDILL
jgi:hypothetical protein